jgi:hypothetical protein
MTAGVWPIVVGLFLGLAVATFVVYQFQTPHQLHTARSTTADRYPRLFLARPSPGDGRHSRSHGRVRANNPGKGCDGPSIPIQSERSRARRD